LATAWNPNPSVGGDVRALALDGAVVYVGGTFTSVGGQVRGNLAALDLATGLATAWDPQASSSVYALAPDGQTVYTGGVFTTIGGQTRNALAALDSTTGLATAWNAGINAWDPVFGSGTVYSLAVSGSTIFAGGIFSIAGGVPKHLASFDAVAGLNGGWTPSPNDHPILAVAVSGRTVFVGGYFTYIGGITLRDIAALPMTGPVAVLGWRPDADDAVRALLVDGPVVYAGGDFRYMGNKPQSYVAAVASPAIDVPEAPSLGIGPRFLGNSPNPFRGSTVIRFSLREAGDVSLEIFDLAGRQVATLLRGEHREQGTHQTTLAGAGLTSGIYFYRLRVGRSVEARKMVVLQ